MTAILPPPMLLACVAMMARIGIACLFAVAAVGKLRRRDDFAAAVAAYRLLPDTLAMPVALVLPPLEIAIATGLVAGMPLALVAGACLLALFAGAMAANLLRGRRDIDCGCDPSSRGKPIGWGLVVRNLAIGALLLSGLGATPSLPLPLAVAAGAAGLLACLIGHVLTLLGSFASPRAIPTSGVR